MFAANSKQPGQRRPTRCIVPAFGHGDQAFALSLFPGSLARTSDGFRLLAGLALGRFFIRLAALHLTKNALALHLLLERPESLIDIVVANEYPQNVSNPLTALDAPSAVDEAVKPLRSARFEIVRGLLAAVVGHFIVDRLALVKRA